MARLTRSSIERVLSDKTSTADNTASTTGTLKSTPQQPQPTKRSSRRLANNSHATSIDSPSTSPKPIESDEQRQQVHTTTITTTTTTTTKPRARSSRNNTTQKLEGEVVDMRELNEKENMPPSHQQTRKSRQSGRGKATAMVKSEENSGAGSLPCTQTDSPISIESAVDTIAVPPESTTASLSEHQEQDQQPKVENSGTAPSATLQKRKWSRPTKVVKLEVEGKAPVQAEPEGGQSNDENDDDDDEQNISSESEDSDGEYGKSTKRTKVERPLPLFKSRAEAEMSEYEKQRLENIRRNQEMLMSLELPTAVTQLQIATLEGKPASEGSSSTDGLFKDTPVPVRISRQREWKAAPKIVQPVRVSNRIRGVAITPAMIGENDKPDRARSSHQDQQNATDDNDATTNADVAGGDGEEDMANLMSGDLFFDKATRERAIRVDGHYHGWLDPGVVERYGFETSAKDAWEANGGGSFSFKDPLGLQANAAGGTKSKTTKRPKHEAKMVAKGLFKKNPNAFFYRHNEPGQEQWTGDWTAEEQEIFLKVAKEHGCGDKWGLFASHIPHRVGYQCSNFYRQVVLPEGMVFDPNYEYTSRGKPIYCGKHNQWRK